MPMNHASSPLITTDAVTATVGTIPVLTNTAVIVIFGLVVARMTTSAVRLISGELPDDWLGITSVTSRAT